MEPQGEVPTKKLNASQNSPESNKFLGFFGLLALFAVIGISLGFISLKKGISSPFSSKQTAVISNSSLATGLTSDETAALRNIDTDKDGLTDYDELYLYDTSPYLADSDSDTFSDNDEIDKGNDPNCPAGQDCTGTASLASNANSSTSANTNGTAAGNTNAVTEIPVTATGEVDLVKLREILKNAGAPAYIVDGTDDATLRELYQTTLGEQSQTNANTGTASNSSANSSGLTDQETLGALKNLSADEMRSLLVENGADQTALDAMSDDDLKTIFIEAVDAEISSSS